MRWITVAMFGPAALALANACGLTVNPERQSPAIVRVSDDTTQPALGRAMLEARADLAEKEQRYRQVLQMSETGNWQHIDALGSEPLITLRERRETNLRRQWELQEVTELDSRRASQQRAVIYALRAEQSEIESDIKAELGVVLLALKIEVLHARVRAGDAQALLEATLSDGAGH
ncbi:MAG: hypothetical protein KF779_13180 [Hyphomonadaceae bacterium]|nr:hypothetical protein [Hyphomonadaceae bacterium]